MSFRRFPLLLAVSASLAVAQTPAPTRLGPDAATFDLLDRSARDILRAFECGGAIFEMRSAGRFGPPDSVSVAGQCIEAGNRTVGVFFDVVPGTTTLRNVRSVTVSDGQPYAGSLDTLLLRRRLYLLDQAMRRTKARSDSAGLLRGPFVIWPRGDSIQAWVIPLNVLTGTAVGGEQGFRYSSNVRTMVGEVDAFAKYRPIAVPTSGTFKIESLEEEMPLLSEVLVANRLNNRGLTVTIVTHRYTSTLAGQGGLASLWVHMPRK